MATENKENKLLFPQKSATEAAAESLSKLMQDAVQFNIEQRKRTQALRDRLLAEDPEKSSSNKRSQ
jgi:hypothetical protein